MKRLIECVPNFSEGRDPTKVEALVKALGSVPGAWVLDRESDADHNRSVITVAGEPEAVARRVLAAMDAGGHEVYAPGVWRFVMLLIRALPRAVLRRVQF